MSDRRFGLLITGLGVLCLTPDALLVRLISCDPFTLLFWRGVLMSLGLSVYFVVQGQLPKAGLKPLLAGGFLACSTTCFVLSLQLTQAANTLIIIATSPLLAAIFARLFLKETVRRETALAIAVAMAGVGLSVSGSWARGSLVGDLFAAGSAVCMAGHFTSLRWWRSEEGPVAVWWAGWMAALIAVPRAAPLSVERVDVFWLALLGLVVLPTAFGLMAVGPRYLSAPEVGLMLLAETVLGPLWVWMVLSERPDPTTLIGGLVVIATLAGHALTVPSVTEVEPASG
ncbi:MAG: DMT family transporter [Vulcanimicrobiota bacterium]